jgi:hypothetical protein
MVCNTTHGVSFQVYGTPAPRNTLDLGSSKALVTLFPPKIADTSLGGMVEQQIAQSVIVTRKCCLKDVLSLRPSSSYWLPLKMWDPSLTLSAVPT